MAAKEKTVDTNGRVTITLPRPTTREEQNFRLVGLNGKFYKVMKGVPVSVPAAVAEVLFNAQEAENQALDFIQSIAQ